MNINLNLGGLVGAVSCMPLTDMLTIWPEANFGEEEQHGNDGFGLLLILQIRSEIAGTLIGANSR